MGRVQTSVLIVEDDPIVQESVARALERESDGWIILRAGTLERARQPMDALRGGVVLLDLRLPDGDAMPLIPRFRAAGSVVIVLSVLADDMTVYAALRAGASGYLVKPEGIDTAAQAVRDALAGGSPISPRIARKLVDDLQHRPTSSEGGTITSREHEVLSLFAKGATYAEVARALGITVNTVRQHVRSLYDKLHVCSKAEAVARVFGDAR